MRKFALLCLAFMLGSTVVHAESARIGDLSIDHVWSRAMPPVAPTAAVYFTISNHGTQDDVLVSASTPAAARAELHEHAHADHGEMMTMQHVPQVVIPAGESVEFKPMGYHVMLFELPRQAEAGEQFDLTLVFDKAGPVELKVPVRAQQP